MPAPQIVTVNVSLQQAPLPNTLQASGALISVGATTGAANSLTLITQLSDLTAILQPANAITSMTWTGGVVTVTTTAPHGLPTSQIFPVTITGATPSAYNGNYTATVTGASTFTYPLVSDPGSETVPGTYILRDVAEVLAMGTTFFAQGSAQSVFVLELGPLDTTHAVAALATYLTNNPATLYGVLVPRAWDANADFLALIATYESFTSKFYFWVTTTSGTYSSYTALMKDVIALVEAPAIPATEFSLAASFQHALAYRPSTTNKVAPFCFSFMFGVTPYPTASNSALLTALKIAGVNYVSLASEGGLTNTMLVWGTTMDKRDFTFWYSIDYAQIQAAQMLANEVINGSNNPLNPLDYDQDGINRLAGRLGQLAANMITFRLATGAVLLTQLDGDQLTQALDNDAFTLQFVINAVPFPAYATQNPSDYRTGRYAGLSMIYIPARGFTQIVLNIVASDFITF